MQSVCNLSNVTYKKTNPIPNKLKIKKKQRSSWFYKYINCHMQMCVKKIKSCTDFILVQ